MKTIIIGNGQLGSYVYKHINVNDKLDIIDYPDFDITNIDNIKDVVSKYDLIINCAAYTAVDKAESEIKRCYDINAFGVINLVDECIKMNRKLIHISTETVYGSNDELYHSLNECSIKSPTTAYSKSKELADYYIERKKSSNILVLRSGWLFGPDNDHNFIEKIKRLLQTKEEIKVVDDQIGSLTSVDLLTRCIQEFINGHISGDIYNVANNGFTSRYENACFIKDVIKSDCNIVKCSSEEFKREADVAKNSCLSCEKLKREFMKNGIEFHIPHWAVDVERVLLGKM